MYSIKSAVVVWVFILFVLTAPMAAMAQDIDGDGMPDAWEILHGCLMADTADGGLSTPVVLLYSV